MSLNYPTGGSVSTFTLNGKDYISHRFIGSGTFNVTSDYNNQNFEILLIAGGGAGGNTQDNIGGGGGGAGGVIQSSQNLSNGSYNLTVGVGGNNSLVANTNGDSGQNTVGFGLTAIGGGGGGGRASGGASGGSGGGNGGRAVSSGGSGTTNQGFDGGNILANFSSGSGGGGATSAGENSSTSDLVEPSGGSGIDVEEYRGSSLIWAVGGDGGATGVSSNGMNGINPGDGGGGGSAGVSSGTIFGGDGQDGTVVITYLAGFYVDVSSDPLTSDGLIVDPAIVSGNANISPEPLSSNAQILSPTVIAVIADSVYITTFIEVNAFAPSNYSVSASENVFNNISTNLNASAEFPGLINITSTSDNYFAAETAEATADFKNPLPIVVALNASANIVQPTLNITPSYFKLVIDKNPLLYWDSGPTVLSNSGSWTGVTSASDSAVDKNVTNPGKLSAVSEGTSWKISQTFFRINLEQTEIDQNLQSGELLQNLKNSHDWSIEFWVFNASDEFGRVNDFRFFWQNIEFINGRTKQQPSEASFRKNRVTLLVDKVLDKTSGIYQDPYNESVSLAVPDETSLFQASELDFVNKNNWHHVVISEVDSQNSTSNIQLYVDGMLISNQTHTKTSTPIQTDADEITFSTTFGDGHILIDHFAIYESSLSPQDVTENYQFIDNISPNSNTAVASFPANATMGNGQTLTSINLTYPPDIFNAFAATFEEPFVNAQINVVNSADLFLSSAEAVDVAFFGTPDYNQLAETMTAFAEELGGYHLSDLYYEYITQNILPYRYVSFDGQDPLSDDGSDNFYSVPSVILNGEVVSPIEGINGRSGKTNSINYSTDGLLLMESEHDDNWGTGENEYHSSFWMQKTESDNSSGLRILWNLNGAFDNQHVILYQYQEKLYLNFNNGSGTFIEQATTNNINLFDGNRHFVVINFDHTGINNFVKLYADGFEVMEVDLGTYTGETINSDTFLGPNDSNNNFPRLSVGSLITPFSVTSLPVVPTNTSIYVDEVVWAKTSIDETQVLQLFNLMPDKINETFFQTSLEASAEILDIFEVTTFVNYEHSFFAANSELLDPEVIPEIPLEYNVEDVMTAVAEMGDAQRTRSVNFEASFMFASAILNGASAGIAIFVSSFELSADLYQDIEINQASIEDGVIPQYIRYLISTRQETILPKKEFM